MSRLLFYSLSLLSALVLLCALALWYASWHHPEKLQQIHNTPSAEYWVSCLNGRLNFGYYNTSQDFTASCIQFPSKKPYYPGGWSYLAHGTYVDPMSLLGAQANITQYSYFGLDFDRALTTPSPVTVFTSAAIPFSYLSLLLVILPLFAVRSLFKRARAPKPGFCPVCHYDLRTQLAGMGGTVCPECGTQPPKCQNNP